MPVGIAYAGLAGVPPIVGIYSAIFPLLAYALLGSSRQLMVGPDAATCLMAATALAPLAGGDPERYLALVPALSLMAGLIYVIAGVARLGFIANFLSQPILTGYLNGIALIILVGQLPKLLGYPSEARDFLGQLHELVERVGQSNASTVVLGLSMVAGLLLLRRLAPAVPGPLVAVVAGIAAVLGLGLEARGVALTGALPGGLPTPRLPLFDGPTYRTLFHDAVEIMLISFASGMLTAKSFARRNRYDIDANQELIAFGASNLLSGLGQGFPVTGADSRTAVNNAVGGRTQLVGVVAAVAMLLVLLLLRGPLALIPTAALAAVVLVAALALVDAAGLLAMFRMSWREGLLSIGTTAGVLVLGVLPGVILAVLLSLCWLIMVISRPPEAVLGHVPGLRGFHSIADYPQARTVPGLLIFRFEADLLFFNIDHFRERLEAAIRTADTPVEWAIVDAAPINWIDGTAVQHLQELREQLAVRGIRLGWARVRLSLRRGFNASWLAEQLRGRDYLSFPTLNAAIDAFKARTPRGEETAGTPAPADRTA